MPLFPLLLLLLSGLSLPALAALQEVPAETGALQQVLATAAAGDVLKLKAGLHSGPVEITVPLTVEGEPGAVIRGDGQGTVISVRSSDVTLRGLIVEGSGISLIDQHSGIFVGKEWRNVRIENNHLRNNLIGIYLWGAIDARVENNTVVGRSDLRQAERGNGIQLWNAPGSHVLRNTVQEGRDGIFTTTSRKNVFKGNRFERVRFAIHYMYTNDSIVEDNISIGNDIGLAIMYSDKLTIRNNLSVADSEHGLLFNYANESVIEGNAVRGRGGDKCLFIYNANKNQFRNNWFEGCRIGIHFTAGSERNRMAGNSFLGNRTQVMYVGTRYLEWSDQGRGNYWSDNPAFDLNGDGIGDTAYRPNDLVDKVVWSVPAAKLLLNSPGIQVIRWAQQQFPALLPGGVVDSAPLMKPEKPPILAAYEQRGEIEPPLIPSRSRDYRAQESRNVH